MQAFNTPLTNLSADGVDAAGQKLSLACEGYATMSLQLAGTISAQKFTLEGSVDLATWVKIPLVNVLSTGAALVSGDIVVAGIYRVNCAGLRRVRLTPAASFAGTGLQAMMACSTAPSLPVILT